MSKPSPMMSQAASQANLKWHTLLTSDIVPFKAIENHLSEEAYREPFCIHENMVLHSLAYEGSQS